MLSGPHLKGKLEAGCDEAGRGCLAGPVVAAAVILPEGFSHQWLNDSKQLSEKKRNILRPIIEKESIAYGVSFVDIDEIASLNILHASFMAMTRAVDALRVPPEYLLIDGNRYTGHSSYPHYCMVKGDARFLSIAAASILAKTYRDELMEKMDAAFPEYGWKKNKGYPTKAHRAAITEYGISKYHRTTFKLLPDQPNHVL